MEDVRTTTTKQMHDGEDDLLADLTAPQRQAVTHVEGPLLVLAGAGSGKTRVITRRITWLVQRVGLAPWNVLAITFTNKAAAEMRQRVSRALTERQASAVTISTFHSLCARVLRIYAARLDLPPGYSIYDTDDQTRAMKQALTNLDISTTNFPPARVLHAVSSAKNELIDPAGYAAQARDFFSKNIARLYKEYQAILTRNKALDFDDLLLKTVELCHRHPDVLAELRQRYQYLLIDEYQDTNHAQFTLAHALAAEHRNICATGDPDQSIYSWRGANIRNILEFEKHYPDAVVVRLEQNYRSTKSILAVADGLIQHNRQRKHKGLWTENETGERVKLVRAYDEKHEADWVVQRFKALHEEEGLPWGAMAVFFRVNSLSRVIEDALRHASVPYQIARGTAFYERKEVKDAVAYLRAINNPADEVNLLRIINLPARGISDPTVKAMQAHAAAHHLSIADVMAQPEQVTALNSRAVAAVARFAKMLGEWWAMTERIDMTSVRRLLERVLQESGLEALYRNDKKDPDSERIANLGELVSAAQQFDDQYLVENPDEVPRLAEKLAAYLQTVSLVSDVDAVDGSQGAVTLMTLHAAKGLEFPAVAMLGVEDGLLPHMQSKDDPSKLEEERRLCFVGITRAQRHLALLHTRYRTVFGETRSVIPSRFLVEIPGDSIERQDVSDDQGWMGERRLMGGPAASGGAYRGNAAPFARGTMVRHPSFGVGRVMSIDTVGAQTRARIQFVGYGMRTLVLEYAKLEAVE